MSHYGIFQDAVPQLVRSSTLTLGEGLEADSLETAETPVFQLDSESARVHAGWLRLAIAHKHMAFGSVCR